MFVVVASRDDPAARTLVARWRRHGAGLLTCTDLSSPGWRWSPGSAWDQSTTVVDGRVIETKRIAGVLTLLPCVFPHELSQIVPNDREYVAQEMTAFLLAWLAGLNCPVLNQPLPTSLMGPLWPVERWRRLAIQSGLRAAPVHRRQTPAAGMSLAEPPLFGVPVTVVGDRWIGDVPSELGADAQRLADAAKAQLLTVFFDRADPHGSVVQASPRPLIGDERVSDAIIDHLQRAACRRPQPLVGTAN